MAWKIPVLVVALVYAAIFTPALFAQETEPPPEADDTQTEEDAPEAEERDNDQVFVIGAGIGGHEFATPHNAGQQTTGLVVRSAFMQQIYAEWYAFDRVGFGLRFITFGTSVSSTTTVTVNGSTATASSEADLDVDNLLFTVNWIPLGGRRYARLGLLAGLGSSDYEFTETDSQTGTTQSSTSGTAALVGIYVDWGADGFGARFGLQFLETDLDPINGSPVDVSGREIYLDLRWAF